MNDVLLLLPYRIRMRFASLANFVTTTIEHVENEWRRSRTGVRRLLKSDRDSIQGVVFVVAVSRFLRDGTEAASFAVDAFGSLGAAGFSVGTTEFEGRNTNVMRGEELYQSLQHALANDDVKRLCESTTPLGRIVKDLVEDRLHG